MQLAALSVPFLPAIYQFNANAQYVEIGAFSTELGKAEIYHSLLVTIPLVLAMLAVACVYLTLHIQSVILTLMGLFQIGLSIGISWFVYDSIFGFKYFGILNMLGVGILLGIGVDAMMIVMEASH